LVLFLLKNQKKNSKKITKIKKIKIIFNKLKIVWFKKNKYQHQIVAGKTSNCSNGVNSINYL
jgi:hypothetical protein